MFSPRGFLTSFPSHSLRSCRRWSRSAQGTTTWTTPRCSPLGEGPTGPDPATPSTPASPFQVQFTNQAGIHDKQHPLP